MWIISYQIDSCLEGATSSLLLQLKEKDHEFGNAPVTAALVSHAADVDQHCFGGQCG